MAVEFVVEKRFELQEVVELAELMSELEDSGVD